MIESIFNGHNDYKLCLYTWNNVIKPKAVVIILHGLFEHMGRYDYFANNLNKNGYIAVGFDMRCLGKTAGDKYGVSPQGDCFNNTVHDVINLTKFVSDEYHLPVVVFGFDYGALIAQRLIECASELYSAVIISGAIKMTKAKVKMAKLFNVIAGVFEDKDAISVPLTQYWYGSLNKQFCRDVKLSSWWSRDTDAVESYNADPLCGRSMSIGFYKNVYNVIDKMYSAKALSCIRKDLPIYIMSGDNDVQTKNAKQVCKLYDMYTENALGKIKLKLYQGARHALLAELNKDEIIGDVIEYYNTVISTT